MKDTKPKARGKGKAAKEAVGHLPEMQRFKDFIRAIVGVPKAEIDKQQEKYEKIKGR